VSASCLLFAASAPPIWDHEAVANGEISADEPAHDVLAAEAFGVPARDPALRHEPIQLPDDPLGIGEPHDVLAAEEFAMPAPRPASGRIGGALARGARASSPLRVAVAAALVAIGLILLRRSRA
jgi:hypothetical protein